MAKKKKRTKKQHAAQAREAGKLGGAPRDPKSLRSLVRETLIDLMLKGSHGEVEEVEEVVSGAGYHDLTLPVQVSQVRNELLKKLKVERKAHRGALTNEDKDSLRKQLSRASVKKALQKLKQAA